MITAEDFETLIGSLISRTKEGKVTWEQESDSRFVLQLPHSQISLEFVSPPAEVDFIRLELHGPTGARVASWKSEEGDKDWKKASVLYSEVHRVVTGLDQVLEDLKPFFQR